MKHLNFATIGCGKRGSSVTKNVISKLNDVTVIAVCDPYLDKAENLAKMLEEKTGVKPTVYTDYKELLKNEKLDAIFNATSWEDHAKVSIDCMKAGIPVAMEVGGAYNEQECWELVDTYEQTKTPVMLMENCCFNKEEVMAYNMAKAGLFGTIVGAHGSYRHDLRDEVAYGDLKRHYRLRNYLNRNCENYPTHELGPIAKILDINRGNRMVSLVSMSSKSCGLKEFVQDKEELSYLKDKEFKQGDIVETLIKCENGELISLKLDTTLPVYYSREFTIRGTKGMYNQDNNMVLLDGKFNHDLVHADGALKYINNANNEEFQKYVPNYWKNITQEEMDAGHGGMDKFEFDFFVDALRNNKEMPVDVYDAASWMAITYLSEQSIESGSKLVEIPDFTRGKYKNR